MSGSDKSTYEAIVFQVVAHETQSSRSIGPSLTMTTHLHATLRKVSTTGDVSATVGYTCHASIMQHGCRGEEVLGLNREQNWGESMGSLIQCILSPENVA
jgi:hypothetical protein